MFHRKFDDNAIYGCFVHTKYKTFDQWREAARLGTEALAFWSDAHPAPRIETLPVENKIYGALKPFLREYFRDKCAYCESEFDSVAWGDVEHYRPKKGVTGEPNHPGYYWLAYSEVNLVPSCMKCNQGEGKRNHFPIKGARATQPAHDLMAEKPLLLNPYDSADCGHGACHLEYVFEYIQEEVLPTGRVKGLTERGEVSVELYKLNRTSLVNRRRKNQSGAIDRLKVACATNLALEKVLNDLWNDREEHASAVRAACQAWIDHRNRLLGKLSHWMSNR